MRSYRTLILAIAVLVARSPFVGLSLDWGGWLALLFIALFLAFLDLGDYVIAVALVKNRAVGSFDPERIGDAYATRKDRR